MSKNREQRREALKRNAASAGTATIDSTATAATSPRVTLPRPEVPDFLDYSSEEARAALITAYNLVRGAHALLKTAQVAASVEATPGPAWRARTDRALQSLDEWLTFSDEKVW